jgi:hypothetical protein
LARIYGRIGAEKILIEKLQQHGVFSLSSLSDVEQHLSESELIIEKLKEIERLRIRQEIRRLQEQHKQLMDERTAKRITRKDDLKKELETLIEKLKQPRESTRNPLKWLLQRYRHWRDSRRKEILENDFMKELERPFRKITKLILDLEKKIENLESNTEDIILERLSRQIREKQRIDKVLAGIQTWISGARGEKEVLQALSELSDDYIVINDVQLHLNPPMITDQGPRFSCQADHVVLGPSGVFNIETKNWSNESINNLDLRSPVEQVRLTGKALFREINKAIRDGKIRITKHHWGERSIRVRNILAMVSAMPEVEFQYVKILPISRLRGYLEYFKQTIESDDVVRMAEWLFSVIS